MRDLTPAEQLVDEMLAKQRAKGRAKYGTGLDAHDGHDWPMEALQELTDATQYLAAEVVRLTAEVARLAPDPACTRCGDEASTDGLCRDCDLDMLRSGRVPVEPPPAFYGPKEFVLHSLVRLDWAHEGWWASAGIVSQWFPSAPDALAWVREETAGVEAALADDACSSLQTKKEEQPTDLTQHPAYRMGVEAMRERALQEVMGCDIVSDCLGCDGCYGMSLEARIRSALLETKAVTSDPECPSGEPFHDHGDGCPSCSTVDEVA